MKKLLGYLTKGYLKETILSPLFKCIEAVLELFVPLVVAYMIDDGIQNSDKDIVVRSCILLVCLGLAGLAFSITAQFFAAKAATGLRIEDWNDERFDDFFGAIALVKKAVEGTTADANDIANEDRVTITFVEEGMARERTFEMAPCSKRAKLLQRQIESCLADMGDSMNLEEKRQVVFDVLKELC